MKQRHYVLLCLLSMMTSIVYAQKTNFDDAESLRRPNLNRYNEAKTLTAPEKILDISTDGLADTSGEASFKLGQSYEERAKNQPEQAMVWYRKALQAYAVAGQFNHAGALNNLGTLYEKNRGVELSKVNTQSHTKEIAAAYYRRSAKLGNVEAQYNLGRLLIREQTIAESSDEWQMWLATAANQGLIEAQATLGQRQQMLANSEYGTPEARNRLRETSTKWLHKAAMIGNADGQFYYAVALQKGWGTKRDLEGAVAWFERASAQNHGLAQLELGRCYAWGLGVTSSNEKALEYFMLAQANGIDQTKTLIHELRTSMSLRNTNTVNQSFKKSSKK